MKGYAVEAVFFFLTWGLSSGCVLTTKQNEIKCILFFPLLHGYHCTKEHTGRAHAVAWAKRLGNMMAINMIHLIENVSVLQVRYICFLIKPNQNKTNQEHLCEEMQQIRQNTCFNKVISSRSPSIIPHLQSAWNTGSTFQ